MDNNQEPQETLVDDHNSVVVGRAGDIRVGENSHVDTTGEGLTAPLPSKNAMLTAYERDPFLREHYASKNKKASWIQGWR